MAKSETKAREENSALRRENKALRERIALLEARMSNMCDGKEVSADGKLHV